FNVTALRPFGFPILNLTIPIVLAFVSSWYFALIVACALAVTIVWSLIYWKSKKRQQELLAAVNALGSEISKTLANARREATAANMELRTSWATTERSLRDRTRRIGAPIVALNHISLSFGKYRVLQDLSFVVREHEI